MSLVGTLAHTGMQIVCGRGHELISESMGHRVCQIDGTWAGVQPECQEEVDSATRCAAFTVEHGTVEGQPVVGGSVSIFCDADYHLHGVVVDQGMLFARRRCVADDDRLGGTALWLDHAPTCKRECDRFRVGHGSVDGDFTAGGEGVQISCIDGFAPSSVAARRCLADTVQWDSAEAPTCVSTAPQSCAAIQIENGFVNHSPIIL